MGKHSTHDAADDREFERLFSALDDVKATDDLKAQTLAAIFARGDDEAEPADETEGRAHHAGAFRVIEGGAHFAKTESAEVVARERAADDGRQETDAPSRQEDSSHTSAARPRKRTLRLRVAAAVLVAALGLGAGVAYAVPASHVMAEADGTTFDLGVNVFGITVSADANTEDGKAVLADVSVRNVKFEDAFDRLIEAYEQRQGENAPTVSVRVDGSFAGSAERLSGQANSVIETRVQEHPEVTADQMQAAPEPMTENAGAPAPTQGQGPAAGQVQETPRAQEGEASAPQDGGQQQVSSTNDVSAPVQGDHGEDALAPQGDAGAFGGGQPQGGMDGGGAGGGAPGR